MTPDLEAEWESRLEKIWVEIAELFQWNMKVFGAEHSKKADLDMVITNNALVFTADTARFLITYLQGRQATPQDVKVFLAGAAGKFAFDAMTDQLEEMPTRGKGH